MSMCFFFFLPCQHAQYYPDAFDYNSLDAKNRRRNFELAFKAAE